MVGSVSITIYGIFFSFNSLTATTVLGSCINEKIPSCILAPPEEVKITNGISNLIASLAASKKPSPTAAPIEPPIKLKSRATAIALLPPI